MPRIVVPPLCLRLVTLAAVLAAGCLKDGEEGETCTLTKDCLSGLVCDNPAGTGGVCRKPGDVPPRLDAAVPADGSGRDTSPDIAPDRAVEAPRAEAGPAERPPGDALDAGAGDGADGDDGGGGDGSNDGAPDAPLDGAVDAAPDGV